MVTSTLRTACALFAAVLFFCGAACKREPARELILYVSADDALFRPVVRSFEEKTGAKVRYVGDTEATKTFGLVRRLLEEQKSPKADVFWSGEPISMVRLAEAGVLRAVPSEIDAANPSWIPLASRARVIVFHPARLQGDKVPRRLGDLLDPALKNKIGLARPQFGTTRTHMAALLTSFGEEQFTAFVRALKANGARLYDGNSMVVQAVAQGEISAGLTDSDDVFSGKQQRWPVESSTGTAELRASAPGEGQGLALIMPHALGLVARPGADRSLADEFARFLLSPQVQDLFVSSGAAIRVRSATCTPNPLEVTPDYSAVAANEERAVSIFDRVWAAP